MKLTAAIKATFYDLYIVQQIPKDDIQTSMELTERQYLTLVQIAKEMDKTEIDTKFMEKLIKQRLLVNPRDSEALRVASMIWERKHKVPDGHSVLDVEV